MTAQPTFTRRQLVERSALAGALLAAPGALWRAAAADAQSRQLRKFVTPLPVPGTAWEVIGADGAELVARQFTVSLHPDLAPTTVWGYQRRTGHPAMPATYLGPTLVAGPGAPASVTFENGLAAPLFPADPMLVPAGVDPRIVRLNTHLHGGRIDDHSDGNPFDAYSGGKAELETGYSYTQVWANDQGDALLWYHDHALGITRTNVYAGLAGGYVLTDGDDNERNLPFVTNSSGVPDPYGTGNIPLDIPLVIQDRNLSGKGALMYPDSWEPEFFGAVPLVNGKAYPYLEVEPRKYRFRFLNGSQSRFYNLVFTPPKKTAAEVHAVQVGVELGFLDTPFPITDGGPGSVLIAPAERADVIVDFSEFTAGQTISLTDVGLPDGVVSPTKPMDEILQFRVVGTKPAADFGPPELPGWGTGGGSGRPPAPSRTSLITLDEILARNGKPLMAVMNNTPFMQRNADGEMLDTPDAPFDTEKIPNGATHEWKIVNLTADTHPIHLHLAHFEVMERQAIDASDYAADLIASGRVPFDPAAPTAAMRKDPATYPPIGPRLIGAPILAGGDEKGPKDTVRANPEQVTTIRATFHVPSGTSLPARYVYHCHILEHEENEMMRPFLVQ
jgi:spore coat protein A, manganese oxidase